MAKLTMTIIEELYSYGKAVYNGEIGLNEATDKVVKTYSGQIADSSASFYIGLYSDYMNGKGSTWNQNSSLVLYYVEHIAEECGLDSAKKAYLSAMKFAKAKSKKTLISDLDALWNRLFADEPPSLLDLYEADFEKWLQTGSEKRYTENTARRYIKALKKAGEWLGITLEEPLMNIAVEDGFAKTEEWLKSLPDFDKINQDHGQGDLSAAMRLYKKFLMILNESADLEGDEEELQDSTKEILEKIRDYIVSKGFGYPEGLIENFFLSLKSKPFVILAGTSGTGKTRLVKLFAEAIGAEYKLVSVRPDWSDGSDLFGHYDLNGNFIEGPVSNVFDAAVANPSKPILLCLDEMNLARVEYYLSDFLSVIESREKKEDGSIETAEIAQYKNGIPDNLYIVGTVNMDETTFPFSKKVLDRANTIEFSYVDLMPVFDMAEAKTEALSLPNSLLRTEYLVLAKDCISDAEYVGEICAELQHINEILLKANAHVGYRVRDEIVFYLLNNKKAEYLITHESALDNEILQKILPRIQGSSASIRDMLCELFKICAADYTQKSGDSDSERMRKILNDASIVCMYRKSAEKLELMVRRFEDDGFTSYWL